MEALHAARHGGEKTTGETWLHKLKIPCRRCTDVNEGREVLRPISAFTSKESSKVDKIWREVLSHGQDACCLRCVRQLRLIRGERLGDDTNMFCEACCRSRPQEFFSSECQEIWFSSSSDTTAAVCQPCAGVKMKTSEAVVEQIECIVCAAHLPL